jgi:hypothetical protein
MDLRLPGRNNADRRGLSPCAGTLIGRKRIALHNWFLLGILIDVISVSQNTARMEIRFPAVIDGHVSGAAVCIMAA